VLQYRRLILFDRDDIVAPAVDDFCAEIPLAKHGIAGDDLAAHRQNAQQFQGGFVFIGAGVNPHLRDHRRDVRRVGRQQVDAGHLVIGAAPQRLAVQGDGVAQVGTALLEPLGQDLFVRADVESAKDIGESCFARRRPMCEAEDFRQFRSMIAGELGDGFQGLHTRQQRDGCKVQNSRQGMP
jgi:hypothetical protein